jgi:acyl-ACP thioesterase
VSTADADADAIASAFDEILPHPGAGRAYEQTVIAGLADAAPGGRVRLDALARWLQDAALNDVVDAGLGGVALWVVRRSRIKVVDFPRFGDVAVVRTWSSGTGRMWAQRRTTVSVAGAPAVEAVALWVHLDTDSMRPFPLTPAEMEVYGPSAAGREVKARLRHPAPPEAAAARDWTFRATELDVADHINNAAYWTPLEADLLTAPTPSPASIDVEIEHKTPAQPGPHHILSAGPHRWIVEAESGAVRASFALA